MGSDQTKSHNLGIVDEKSRNKGLAGEFRAHFKYGMDCQYCHTIR
nr:hypothetical protein [uncultured Desulfobacter sp.]